MTTADDLMIFGAIFVLSALGVIVLILGITPLAERLGLIDVPDDRKRHRAVVPLVGGIAIYIIIFLATLLLDFSETLINLLLISSLVLGVGLADDALGLGVRPRFFFQVVATVAMIFWGGLWIQSLGLNSDIFEWVTRWFGVPITIFAVVGLTNGFNMVDGIDGLASGQILIGLLSTGLTLLVINGEVYQVEWLILLTSSVLAFWFINLSLLPIRQVFLGDAGSLFLGFLMAWVLIYYTQRPIALMHPVAALWCVTIPVYDTLIVIAKRLKNNLSPVSSDRNHLHHLMIDGGLNSRSVLAIILGLSAVTNFLGICLTYLVGPEFSIVCYCTLLVVFGYGVLHPKLIQTIRNKLRSA